MTLVGGSIIRNIAINVADEMGLEFVRGLQSLGVERSVVCLITYLKYLNKGSSKDIEAATGLSQSEVSSTMQTLREMGWVTEHKRKGNGKGRPPKIYALSASVDEVIKYYEAEKNQESARAMEAIQRLKEMRSQKELSPS